MDLHFSITTDLKTEKALRVHIKPKPTNAGKIALEWQAAQLNSGAVAKINFSVSMRKHQPKVEF